MGATMKLLIVEDEKFTREGIVEEISWKSIGISSIELAVDGKEGIEKAIQFNPDIILTDVCMPKMNGVDMAFCIREFCPACRFIFMSGYSDKEYLKAAIRLSAVNYIEKPIDIREIEKTIKNLIEEHKQLELEKKKHSSMEKYMNQSLPILKKQILPGLLRKQNNEDNLACFRMCYPTADIHADYCVFLVNIVQNTNFRNEGHNITQPMIYDMIDKRLRLNELDIWVINEKGESILEVMICMQAQKKPMSMATYQELLYQIKHLLECFCDFMILSGNPCSGIESVYESYQQAVIALQQSFLHQPCNVVFYNSNQKVTIAVFSEEEIQSFGKTLLEQAKEKAIVELSNIMECLKTYDGTPTSSIKDYLLQIVKMIYRVGQMKNTSILDESENLDKVREKIFNMSFLIEASYYINEKVEMLYSISEEYEENNLFVEKIQQYIRNHFSNPNLSLSLLAKEFSLSDPYLCKIFKKAANLTVNQYILNQRLDYAKQELVHNYKRIKQIAREAGFSDSNYFVKVFKKNMGVTPLEYRELNG